MPNNPDLPLIYLSPLRIASSFDPAAVFEELFELNGWGNCWRDSIYRYVHYQHVVRQVVQGFHGGSPDPSANYQFEIERQYSLRVPSELGELPAILNAVCGISRF